MYKLFICWAAIWLLNTSAYAQHTKEFKITAPATQFSNSKYNKLSLIDSRVDTTNLGTVRVGAFDRNTKVIAKPSLFAELDNWFSAFIDQSAGKGELALQLRRFSMDEVSGMGSMGYCTLRAELYEVNNQQYKKLKSIDTVLFLKSADVTKRLLDAGGIVITGFISENLLNKAPENGVTYSHDDLKYLDSLEKKQLKLYSTSTYTDGLYTTYNSFKNQIPDKRIEVSGFDVNMADVKAPDADGKLQKVKKKNIYAIVYKGQLYIATRFDYYPLNKIKDELVFTGRAEATQSDVAQLGFYGTFGLMGSLIGAIALTDGNTYEMKIDHVNGKFIVLKKIPVPVVEYSKMEDY